MIPLIVCYALFICGGFVLHRRKWQNTKEKVIFVATTSLGLVMWICIFVRYPLDLNKAIAVILDGLR
ncbi:hypothetical protein [Paenibacillus sp. R14(2021)]|uniref:hypothetical protein n=1 Tax=Paenibacillus sp. R14(2021) TaxID=2859228 RepID=UPI001C614952|nr:hypothetical protein [Paenibacillus sp. R14(2021)]